MKKLMIILMLFILQNTLVANSTNKSNTNLSKQKQIPKFNKKAWGFDDFVFTKSGKEFYTYKNGVLHHWQFMPVIKHLGSIKIGFSFSLEVPIDRVDTYLLQLSLDENKMLFYKKDFIEVWDLKKKKKLASKKITSLSGVMTEKGFFTGDKDYLFQLWSLDELKELKNRKLIDNCEEDDYHTYRCSPFSLYADKDNIYMVTYDSVHRISPKTLIRTPSNAIPGGFFGMTYDKKFLLSGLFGHLRLEDFSIVPYGDKNFRDKYFYKPEKKHFIQRGSLGMYRKGVRVNDTKVGCSMRIQIKKDQIRGERKISFTGVGDFYHNDKGNWYFGYRKYDGRWYFDSDMSYKALNMTKSIHKKFKKKLNIKDLRNGKY